MIIRYEFVNRNKNYEDFEYDVDIDEAIDYLLRTRKPEEILRDYIDEFGDRISESDLKDWISEFNFDFTYDGISKMTDKEKEIAAKEVLKFPDVNLDIIEDSNMYYDELKDYFEQEAFDLFRELD